MNILYVLLSLFIMSLTNAQDGTGAPLTSEAPATNSVWMRSSEMLEDSGVTTTEDDRRGNWYEKRQLFFEARGLYEKLHEAVAQLMGSTTASIEQRRDGIVQKIMQFVSEYTFKEGAIDEEFNNVTTELEKERKKDIQLTEEERELLVQAQEKKKELEFLKQDIQQFNELIMALDKAFTTLREQLNRAQDYEHKGWEAYDKIADVLNDELAQQLSLSIKGYLTNVSLIERYIKNDFIQFLDQTERLVEEQSQKIKVRVDELQSQGLELLVKVHEAEVQAQEQPAPKEVVAIEKATPQSIGMRILYAPYNGILWIWKQISVFFSSIVSLFYGKTGTPLIARRAGAAPESADSIISGT